MALSGKNLEDLYPLLGISLPPTSPYALDGRFIRDGNTWRYEGFTGKVGDSDLAGTASVETGGERPFLRADLVSKRRSEEHTSELQSLMRLSYAVFCLKKKNELNLQTY